MSQASVMFVVLTLQMHFKIIKCKSNVYDSPAVAVDTCSPIQYLESCKDEKNKSQNKEFAPN